ncbi:hypothetical protein GCM10010502_33260 [Kitasatospora aureofaciens]|uniref:Uncharacterized protein n=2 Tax=Kitasatospora aureofaciens TaxID=1894 RepID=A0A8H9HPU9_KITAU|nr:hypothetical protein GCM10010502_33260 [Kitasatospora aureofaciens]
MATHDSTAMATPGYGKQSAPEQLPRSAADFSHLPAREAYIASLIDHLPDGAAMDVKTLAVLQSHYGQMACRTVLNNLSTAGHLRRVRERISSKDCRWVFRTYFSRTPRSDAWWTQFLTTGEASEAGEASTSGAPDPPKERTLNRTSPTSPRTRRSPVSALPTPASPSPPPTARPSNRSPPNGWPGAPPPPSSPPLSPQASRRTASTARRPSPAAVCSTRCPPNGPARSLPPPASSSAPTAAHPAARTPSSAASAAPAVAPRRPHHPVGISPPPLFANMPPGPVRQ